MKDVPLAGLAPNVVSQCLYSLGALSTSAGDMDSAGRYGRELDAYAARVPEPYVQSWQMNSQTIRLRMQGDLEASVAIARNFTANGAAMGIELWAQLMGSWCSTFALECLGRHEEVAGLNWAWQTLPYGGGIVTYFLASAGRAEEARRELRRIISELRIGEPDDWAEDVTLNTLLNAAVLIPDEESAGLLYKRLEGAEEWYIFGGTTNARIMGMAALLLGDPAPSRKLMLTALEVAGRVGDRVETARSHFGLARVLFEHFPEERAAAASHLNTATQEAQAMKMKPLLEECLALKLRFQGITSTDVYTSIDTVARVVEAEKPDLRTHAAPDGTVTIMFSDIEGSTAMADRLGDKRFMDVLREHNAIIREQVKAHGGFEVKSEGDGFMVAFQSAGKALACASAIQKALAERNARVGRRPGMGAAGGAAPGGAGRRYGAHGPPRRRGDQGRRGLLRPQRDHGRARRLAGQRRRDTDVRRGEGAAVGIRCLVGSEPDGGVEGTFGRARDLGGGVGQLSFSPSELPALRDVVRA